MLLWHFSVWLQVNHGMNWCMIAQDRRALYLNALKLKITTVLRNSEEWNVETKSSLMPISSASWLLFLSFSWIFSLPLSWNPSILRKMKKVWRLDRKHWIPLLKHGLTTTKKVNASSVSMNLSSFLMSFYKSNPKWFLMQEGKCWKVRLNRANLRIRISYSTFTKTIT